jgi:hypothetical protein
MIIWRLSRRLHAVDKLKELASSHLLNEDQRGAFKNAFENFLKTEARGKTPEGKPKKYKDHLRGRFKLAQVARIEPHEYSNSISGKVAVFTSQTIMDWVKKMHLMWLNYTKLSSIPCNSSSISCISLPPINLSGNLTPAQLHVCHVGGKRSDSRIR